MEIASSGAEAAEMVAAVNEAALTKSVAELVFDTDFSTTVGADLGKAVGESFSKAPYNIDPANIEFVGVYPGSVVVLVTFKDGIDVPTSSQDFTITVENDTLTATSAVVCGPQDGNCAMQQEGANSAAGEAAGGDDNNTSLAIAVICVAVFGIAFIAAYYQRKNRSTKKEARDMATLENGMLSKLTPTSNRVVLANGPFPLRRSECASAIAAVTPTVYDTTVAANEDAKATAPSYETATSDDEGTYVVPVHAKDQPKYDEPTDRETGSHMYAGIDYANMNNASNDTYDEPAAVACSTNDYTTSGAFEPNCFVLEGNMQTIRLQSVRRANPSFRNSLYGDVEVLGPAGVDETAES